MNLSPHFTLAEMSTTSTGLPNTPPAATRAALVALCVNVLEPWRARVGRLRVNSGYRSPDVNAAVGGSRSSDHMLGRAADVVPLDTDLVTAWSSLVGVGVGLPIDQAIIYVRPRGKGWIHVSHRATGNRGEILVDVGGGGYVPRAAYTGPLVLR